MIKENRERIIMKDATIGIVEFIRPSGYGFVSTEDGNVFICVKNFFKPVIALTNPSPMVTYIPAEIDPKDIKKGVTVDMVIVGDSKGKVAKSWCFHEAHLAVVRDLANMPIYRLTAREIVTGRPYEDPINHCWVCDQHLAGGWDWQGYKYQLKDFRPRPNVEYQTYIKTIDDWIMCPCPLRLYNGGPLFELPFDWTRTV